MAYPQKHKQDTIDFFDKMQEKMQVEESKRRKLNQKSSSSQPELMFLQFKSNNREPLFTSNMNSMSQQTLKKKTWKTPTISISESDITDFSKMDNNNGVCTSSSTAFINNEIPKVNNKDNRIKKVNDFSPEIDTHKQLVKTDIKENTASHEKDKSETSNYYKFALDQKLDTGTESIGAVEYESTLRNISVTSSSNNNNGDLDLNNLVVECSNKTMVLSQCLLNMDHISDHDQEDFPIQQNQNLSKELDITISNHGTPTQRNPNLSKELEIKVSDHSTPTPTKKNPNYSKESDTSNSDVSTDHNDREFFGDQQREISDNEDIQLINSIDLILSENQENQLSQGESNIHADHKKTPVKHKNSILRETQEIQLSQRQSNSKTDVKKSPFKHKNKIGQVVELHSEISSKTGVERSKLNVDTDSSQKFSNSSTESSKMSMVFTHDVCMESDNHSESLKCNEYNEIKVNLTSLADCGSNRKNPTEIICQAIREVKKNGVFRSPEESADHHNMKSYETKEFNQPVLVNQTITEEKDKIGVNVFESGCIESDVVIGPVNTVKEGIINETRKNDMLVRKQVNLNELEGIELERSRSECEDLKEDNISFNMETNDRSFALTNEGKIEMNNLNRESDLCFEEISGFDDDGSCLMINNSQLMELEQKYYENPDNLKQQIVPSINSTQTKNCTCHMTKTVGPQKTDVGVQTEHGIEFISLNSNSAVLPQIPAATAQWTKKAKETEKQIRDTIQEVGRLNAILIKIRKDLWPQRNAKETKF